MYTVNGKPFQSFTAAIAYANPLRADVLDVATGARRWTPAPTVSKARMKKYENQKNAHAAYLRSKV